MTLRDDMLPVADQLRGLFSEFGVSRYTVTVRRDTWTGGRVGVGTNTTVDLPIVSASGGSPLVQSLTDISSRLRDVMLAGGTVQMGDLVISEITPAYASAGAVSSAAAGSGTLATTVAIPAGGLSAPGTYPVVIEIVAPGAIGTATYQQSFDGGATWSSPITTEASVPIPSVGIALAFGGTSFETGDTFSFALSCGGYTPLQLRPVIAPGSGDDVYYVLVGDAGVEEPFTFIVARFDDPVGYFVVVRRRVL